MENKRYSLSFDEIENKIEVDLEGLVFEVKNIQDKKYYEELDTDNQDIVDIEIEKVIGKGSIEKINKLRKEKGKDELDLGTKLNLLLQLIGIYNIAVAKNTGNAVYNIVNKTNNTISEVTSQLGNRKQRRNYNRAYNRNNRRYY